jgi:hypothetical protein
MDAIHNIPDQIAPWTGATSHTSAKCPATATVVVGDNGRPWVVILIPPADAHEAPACRVRGAMPPVNEVDRKLDEYRTRETSVVVSLPIRHGRVLIAQQAGSPRWKPGIEPIGALHAVLDVVTAH